MIFHVMQPEDRLWKCPDLIIVEPDTILSILGIIDHSNHSTRNGTPFIWEITMFNGKIHYFYGHFQVRKLLVRLPGRLPPPWGRSGW